MELQANTPAKQPDMKVKYDEMLKEVAQDKPPKVLMRRQWVRIMIERILSAKDILENEDKSTLPKVVTEALENYDVDYTLPEPRLVTKPQLPDEPVKFVIALEDSFETVLKAHLFTEHGGCTDMNKWLNNSQYILSIICAPVLISVCKKCFLGTDDPQIISLEKSLKDKSNLLGTSKCVKKTNLLKNTVTVEDINDLLKISENLGVSITADCIVRNEIKTASLVMKSLVDMYTSLAFVNILDMSHRPDRSFNYLLVYQEPITKFFQLRPLTDVGLIDETTMELIKLFCDFASPKCIVVQTKLKDLFEEILLKLNCIFDPKISLETCDPIDTINSDVNTKVSDWMTHRACDSWSIGCYFVQWQINNSKGADSKSPYELFFGSKLDCTIISNIKAEVEYADMENTMVISKNVEDSQSIPTAKSANILEPMQSIPANTTPLNSLTAKRSKVTQQALEENDIKIDAETTLNNLVETPAFNNFENTVETPTTVNNTDVSDNLYNVVVKTEPDETEVIKDKQKYVCCTCKDLMRTQVYFCCVCKNSLHLFCGARRKGEGGIMENICYTCC